MSKTRTARTNVKCRFRLRIAKLQLNRLDSVPYHVHPLQIFAVRVVVELMAVCVMENVRSVSSIWHALKTRHPGITHLQH